MKNPLDEIRSAENAIAKETEKTKQKFQEENKKLDIAKSNQEQDVRERIAHKLSKALEEAVQKIATIKEQLKKDSLDVQQQINKVDPSKKQQAITLIQKTILTSTKQ